MCTDTLNRFSIRDRTIYGYNKSDEFTVELVRLNNKKVYSESYNDYYHTNFYYILNKIHKGRNEIYQMKHLTYYGTLHKRFNIPLN